MTAPAPLDSPRLRPAYAAAAGGVILLLVAAVTAAYSNTFYASFQFDDFTGICQNEALRLEFTPDGRFDGGRLYRAAFTGIYQKRPLSNLTYALNLLAVEERALTPRARSQPTAEALVGPPVASAHVGRVRHHADALVGFHLFNLGVHLAMTLMVLLFSYRLLDFLGPRSERRRLLTAAFVALLWALHPVQTQAVTYLLQRMTSMAAFFMLAGLYCFLAGLRSRHRWAWWAPALFLQVLGQLSKEIASAFPIAALGLVLWLRLVAHGRLDWRRWRGRRPAAAFVGLSLVIALGFGYWYLLQAGGVAGWSRILSLPAMPARDFSSVERVLTQARVVAFEYPPVLVWPDPARLNVDHAVTPTRRDPDAPHLLPAADPDAPANGWLWAATLAAFAVLALLCWRAWRWRTRAPLLLFAVGWYLCFLAIESSFMNLEMMFEHRLYLPSVGVLFAIVVAAEGWMVRAGPRWRMAAPALAGAVALAWGLWTYGRNEVWTTHESLWADAARKSPSTARVFSNLAVAYGLEAQYLRGRRQQTQFAGRELARATAEATEPARRARLAERVAASEEEVRALIARERLEAERQAAAARHAVRCRRSFWEAWHNLGAAYLHLSGLVEEPPAPAADADDAARAQWAAERHRRLGEKAEYEDQARAAFEQALYYHEQSISSYQSLVGLLAVIAQRPGAALEPELAPARVLYAAALYEFAPLPDEASDQARRRTWVRAVLAFDEVRAAYPDYAPAAYRQGFVLGKIAALDQARAERDRERARTLAAAARAATGDRARDVQASADALAAFADDLRAAARRGRARARAAFAAARAADRVPADPPVFTARMRAERLLAAWQRQFPDEGPAP